MRHPQLDVIVNKLKEYLIELYQEQLHSLLLFGSQARGDARADSDIDVLIALNGAINPSEEIKRTSEFVANLCLENNVVISRVFVSAERLETEKSPFFLNVRQEAIPV